MPTKSFTVRDFYEYEKMLFGCSTDGALPRGQHKMYRVVRGKLTHIPVQDMSSLKLNPNYILIFGTYGDDPQTEEDLSTLACNGFIKSVFKASEFLASKAKAEANKAAAEKAAKPVQKTATPVEPATPAPEKNEVIVRSESVVADATAYEVVDLPTYERASDIIRTIKQMAKEVGATFDPMIEKAHQAHKEALAQKAKFVRPLENAERTLKGKMAEWYRAEQARAEAERKAAEEARSRELAEQRRKADEAMAQAMAEREAEIEAALASGDVDKAEEIGSKPVMVEVPGSPVIPVFEKYEAPKIAGVSARKKYRAVVTDFAALVQAAATNPNLLGYLQVNQAALDSIAMTTKGTAIIPGVVINEDVIMGVRA